MNDDTAQATRDYLAETAVAEHREVERLQARVAELEEALRRLLEGPASHEAEAIDHAFTVLGQ